MDLEKYNSAIEEYVDSYKKTWTKLEIAMDFIIRLFPVKRYALSKMIIDRRLQLDNKEVLK